MRRELIEEWGDRARELEVGAVADVLHHDYPEPGPEVILIVFHVDADAWNAEPGGPLSPIVAPADVELEAVLAGDLDPAKFLAADRPFVERVRDGLVVRR